MNLSKDLYLIIIVYHENNVLCLLLETLGQNNLVFEN